MSTDLAVSKDSDCNLRHWQKQSLLQNKGEFERLLMKEFDDNYFIDKIKILYPIFKHKLELTTTNKTEETEESKTELTLINEIYSISCSTETKLDHFDFVPVKIDYFMFNPKFNKQFKIISHHRCDHTNSDEIISYNFISGIIEFIETNIKYTTKLDLFPNQQNQSLISETMQCGTGCCMECAELITPDIIRCCYLLSRYQKKAKFVVNAGKHGLIPFNIDTLCILCIWLANILQHDYIKKELKENNDLMATIFLTLYRLMSTAHILYRDKLKLYKNRRNMIYFAIWRLMKQIILNHGYIKKYYQNKDIEKDRFCEAYQIEMVEWMMNELNILSEIIKNKRNSMGILNSLKYDYFGGIIILMSLLRSKDAQNRAKGITHSMKIIEYECIMELWMVTHLITHNTKSIGRFFKESIVHSNKLKKCNRIKCQWRHCKKWKKCDVLYRCKQCKAVTYCSKHCQKMAWTAGFHRFVCNKY